MDKIASLLGLLRDGGKAGLKFGVDMASSLFDKAAANPKATAALAGGGGLYLDPSWIVSAGTIIVRFGKFVAQVGAAMGG